MMHAPLRPPEPGLAQAAAGPRARRRRSRASRVLLVAAILLAVLVTACAAAFGPIVRGRVAKEAARRHLEVEVGAVGPGLFAVSLRDVRVRPEGVNGLEARLERVRLDLGTGSLEVDGGTVTVDGEPEELAERVKGWRARSGGEAKPAADASGPKKAVRLENLGLAWRLPSGGEVSGTALRLVREETGAVTIACGKCTARREHIAVEATAADVDLGADGVFKAARAQAVDVRYEPPRAAAPAPPAAGMTEPVPPPLPIHPVVTPTRRGAKALAAAGPTQVAPPAPAPEGPVLPLPNLHALRSRIATVAAMVAPRLPEGGRIDIDGLSAKVDIGGDPVAFGPAPFRLSREGDRARVAFSSGAGDPAAPGSKGTTPLSIDADIPLTGGEVNAQLAGGPVSLSLLGVREGTKGLTDVTRGAISGKGRVVLSAFGDALTFDGQVALRSISLKQPKIAPEALRGLDLAVSARGVLDDQGKLRLDDAQVDMGALHVKAHGTVEETTDHFAVSLNLDVAPAACQALLDSAPQGLLPTVRAARMVGVFGANLSLAFDTRTIDKLALDYRIDDQCRMHEVPRELSRDHFTGTFAYRTYHPDGSLGETVTGPGSPSWTALDDISPFMVAAVLTTEDGAFYKHHGFNHSAIRSSVAANLKARRFVRGASTISMQLAKNLFLARDKALSRKIEEVILTDYLEQIFRKDDLLELYLNVVEFGPDVYGVTQAAEHYFGRKPEELDVLECYFLASLLPSPIRYGKMRERGEVSETWMRHLHALMAIGAKNGKISHSELEDGLRQSIVFVRPGDPRPEPRKPVNTTRRDPYEDNDAAWRPLE